MMYVLSATPDVWPQCMPRIVYADTVLLRYLWEPTTAIRYIQCPAGEISIRGLEFLMNATETRHLLVRTPANASYQV